MSTAELTTRYTAEDLLAMPDGDRYEVVRGELLEKHVSEDADWISGEILSLLRNFTRGSGLGWVFGGERLFRCFPHDPTQGRKPDVSYLSAGKLPGGPTGRGITPVAPDIAVEVVSPRDAAYALEEKLSDYRRAGVPLVWVVYPNRRTVHVYAGGSEVPSVLHEADTLTGGDVLPGFAAKVAELFPPAATNG